jgi:fructose-specific phosphotransferase system IIC component
MDTLTKGLIAGLVFGIVTVAIMLPLKIDDKRNVLIVSFISRFTIGLAIAVTALPGPGWLTGIVIGLLLSLPQAMLTRMYGPILGNGAIGGAIVGFLFNH